MTIYCRQSLEGLVKRTFKPISTHLAPGVVQQGHYAASDSNNSSYFCGDWQAHVFDSGTFLKSCIHKDAA